MIAGLGYVIVIRSLQENENMRHEKQLAAEESLFMVVDVQEAFVGHIAGKEQVILTGIETGFLTG